MKNLHLSTLKHTWILDFDGTLVIHNGYKTGEDEFLPGAKEFLQQIPSEDFVIILTARDKQSRQKTEEFLKKNHIRYDALFFEIPMGERILINDDKPSGLPCAYALTPKRNQGFKDLQIVIDPTL